MPETPETPSFVVELFKDEQRADFVGTGFLVARDWVVTCKHVVDLAAAAALWVYHRPSQLQPRPAPPTSIDASWNLISRIAMFRGSHPRQVSINPPRSPEGCP